MNKYTDDVGIDSMGIDVLRRRYKHIVTQLRGPLEQLWRVIQISQMSEPL